MSCLTQVQGAELGPSATVKLIPNHWAFSPAPFIVQEERLTVLQATPVLSEKLILEVCLLRP